MSDDTERQQVQHARAKFMSMAAAYALGTFNDNFFKQVVILLAVAAGRPQVQGWAVAIFTLPFVLFAAPAGWMADRYPKSRVVIGAKSVEVLAAVAGAVGLCTGNYALMAAMLGLMGLQATFFSPALNGSIPELYPATYVTKANGALRMAVTVAILAGTGLAGMALDLDLKGTGWGGVGLGRLTVSSVILGTGLVGLLVSLGMPRRPAADPGRPFPWTGPLDTLKELGKLRGDRLLALVLLCDMFIWAVGSMQIQLINPLGLVETGMSKTSTSLLLVSQLLGIGVGGLLAGHVAKGPRWFKVLPAAATGMAGLMGLLALMPLFPTGARMALLVLLLALLGLAGGLFLIPCESFLQVRPAPERKGAVWASANFAAFSGILLSGPAANALLALCRPSLGFAVLGTFSLLVGSALFLIFHRREWS